MSKQRNIRIHHEERLWFFMAVSLFLVVFAAYIYFVSASVVQVVIRKEVNQQIADVSSYVSQLEAEYIEAQHKVSSEIASQEGFQTTDENIFVERTQTSLVLSARNGS